MYILAKIIQFCFPLMALMLLILGFKKRAIHYTISALWLSLITLLLQFQSSGNQIFGDYFDYMNAAIYTFTLLILIIALIRIMKHLSINSHFLKYISSLVSALVVVCASLVSINVWVNAFFVEDKKMNTPLMQVALFNKPDYCQYRYIFYKISPDSSVMYLCPNHYGLIASIGRLSTAPDFVTNQLHLSVKNENATP